MIPLKLLLPEEYEQQTEISIHVKRHFNLPEGNYGFAIMYSLEQPQRLYFTPFRREDPKPLFLFSIDTQKKNAKPHIEDIMTEEKTADALLSLFQQELPKHIAGLQSLVQLVQTLMKDPADPIHQRLARRTAWLATRFSLPSMIEEGGEPFHPDMIAWVKAEDGEVMTFELIHPTEGDNALLTPLKRLVREHGAPKMICVEKESQSNAIRAAMKNITVSVEELPELLFIQQSLLEYFEEENKPAPTYLSGDATQEDVARLFQVAAKMFRAEPWKKWGDYPMLQIDAPNLDVNGGALSMMGNGQTSFGFLFFANGEDAYDFYQFASEDDTDEDDNPDVPFLAFEFCPAAEVSPELRKEIAAHTWEVATTRGFPVLKRLNEEMRAQTLTKRDIQIATICCEVALAFYAAHHKQLAIEEPFEATGQLKSNELGAVSFTWPHPEVLIDDNDEGPTFELTDELSLALFEKLASFQKKPKKRAPAKKASPKKAPAKKPAAKKVASKETKKPATKKPSAKKTNPKKKTSPKKK